VFVTQPPNEATAAAAATSPSSEPVPLLDLRLLGTPSATVQGKPLAPLRSRKGLHLLALLALAPGRERDRTYLAGTLWPDSDESLALANLRRALTNLKAALGEAARLVASPSSRTLRLDGVGSEARVDVAAFDAAIARGDAAALEEAIGLYDGPLLSGDDADWIFTERLSRERAFVDALERAAEARLAAGDVAAAETMFRRAVAAEPLRESAHRGLMRSLAEAGNPSGALESYHSLRALLRRRVNAEPAAETRALYESLREAARQPSPAVSERAAPREEQTAAPVRLPQAVSAFIGRDAELREVAQHLEAERLVTLVGAGGVGKTRLALETARRAAPDFPDGVAFTDLAPLTDPALVTAAIASALELTDGDGNLPPREALLRALEPRRLLLVLDNCEHLLAACAEVADALLRRCPGVRLLATSRQPLGLMGERVWRVPALSIPDETALPSDDGALVAALKAHDGTRLFLERATAASPQFTPAGRQGRALVAVCRRLDGIALAIELAAARVRVLTVEQIHTRLDDRFRLLTGGDRAALPRQQTLRALIDWSYDLLDEKERALLARLSVFAGGWTLEAAEQVCGSAPLQPEEVVDLLTALVDKSLVLFDDARAAEGGAGRYRMLETVREYAGERLAAGEEDGDALRDRHLAYFAARADGGENGMTGADQIRWADFFAQEQGNLRAAWEWATVRRDADRALIIPAACWRFQRARGFFTQGRAWVEEALARFGADASPAVRKRAHTSAGNLAMIQGDYPVARGHIEALIAASDDLGDDYGRHLGLTNLGILEEMAGNHERACELLESCLPFFRSVDNRAHVATIQYNLSIVHSNTGNVEAAFATVRESLATRRSLGDRRGIAVALNHLAQLEMEAGEAETALDHVRECIAIAHDLKQQNAEATAYSTLGSLLLHQGQYDRSRACLAYSLRLFRAMESRTDLVILLENCAALAAAEGDQERSARLFGAATHFRDVMGLQGVDSRNHPVRDALRDAMGEAYAARAQEGAVMDWDRAIDYALEGSVDSGPPEFDVSS